MKGFFKKKLNKKIIILAAVLLLTNVFIFSFGSQRVNAEVDGTSAEDVGQNLANRIQNNSQFSDAEKIKKIEEIKTVYPEKVPNTIMSAILTVLSWIAYGIGWVIGLLLTLISKILVQVASYNDFINVPTVITGWVIVRDICNMFFVLILLVIAFGTILRIPSYEMKKALPKLIIAAVLINFSRTIFGLIIDFSQVVMLTFVNGFVQAGGNNFVELFQINKYWTADQVEKAGGAAMGSLAIFGGLVAGVAAMLVTLAVMVVILGTLVMRIIMLWVYTIFSPFVFLGSAMPAIGKYTNKIWEDFTKNVIGGPVLAFFLWLALMTVGSSADKMQNNLKKELESASLAGSSFGDQTISKDQLCAGPSAIFCENNFQRYIITIALLIGGLIVAQQIGGAAGQMAGKGMAAIQKGGRLAGRKFTGYGMVADTLSKYSAMRKSARDQRITTAAEKLAYGVGTVKQVVGKAVSAPFRAISSVATGQHRLNKKRKEREGMENDLKADKYKVQQFENKHGKAIRNKEDFTTDNDETYIYKSSMKKWEVRNKEGKYARDVEPDDLQTDVIHVANADIAKKESTLEVIKKGEEEMQKKVERNTKIWRRVGGGAGAVLGLATGGLAAAIGGIVLGSYGISGLNQKISDAGKSDLKAASNYRSRQTDDARNENKNEDNETILATMDDTSKNVYVRAAAAMEAASRKIIDLDTAKRKREQIGKEMNSDKRVMGQFDAILEKNYVGATKLFKDLEPTANLKDQEKADRTITQRYADGTHTMKELDNGSLEQSIKQLANGLKTSTFTRQYKDLSDEKKGVVKSALQGQNTYEAKEKLAFATNVDSAFGSDATAKDRFIKNLTYDQLKDIVDAGDEEQKQALIVAVNGQVDKFSDSIKNRLFKTNSGVAQEIKNVLNIPNKI